MSDIKDLLDELDMESWLDYEGIRHKLTRGTRGVQLNIRECPCCGNSKWKVYMNAESGLGNCFVCDERFTKWKFVASHLNASNADVFTHLERYMQGQGWRPRQTATAPVKQGALKLPASLEIPIKGKNLAYLANRNITIELSKFFHLRFCHKGIFKFTNPSGGTGIQDYSNRIIIPVYDMDGSLVSFQGRDITGTKPDKYLFPPGYASTGSILYNAQNATNAPRVIIGEGVFDCIAIKAAIDEDTVLRQFCPLASFGKKLGDEQIQRLIKLKDAGTLKDVIFMWDSEQAAIEAAVDAGLRCRSLGLPAKIALLPKGKDPNEVAPQVVRDAIWNAVTVDPMIGIKLKLEARKLA